MWQARIPNNLIFLLAVLFAGRALGFVLIGEDLKAARMCGLGLIMLTAGWQKD